MLVGGVGAPAGAKLTSEEFGSDCLGRFFLRLGFCSMGFNLLGGAIREIPSLNKNVQF